MKRLLLIGAAALLIVVVVVAAYVLWFVRRGDAQATAQAELIIRRATLIDGTGALDEAGLRMEPRR